MANTNGKVPGTYVTPKELKDLSELLSSFRDYILSHEARLELIEGWINEFMQAQGALDTQAEDGTTEIEAYDAAEAANLAEFAGLDEPADDTA